MEQVGYFIDVREVFDEIYELFLMFIITQTQRSYIEVSFVFILDICTSIYRIFHTMSVQLIVQRRN